MEAADERLSQHLTAETDHLWMSAETRGLQSAFESVHERAQQYLESPQQGERTSVKEKYGRWLYYTRTTAEQPADHYLRAPIDDGPEQSVLDINALSTEAQGLIEIGKMKISDSHKLLAHTQQSGEGPQTAIITDIQSGAVVDTVQNVHGIEWFADEQHVLYTVTQQSDSMRPCRVLRHKLGSCQGDDKVLLEEGRPDCFLSLSRTKDGRFISVTSSSKTASEVHMLDASQPGQKPWLVQRRQDGLEYFVEHHSGTLLILTNAIHGTDLTLACAPLTAPDSRHWEVAVPFRDGIAVEDMDVFRHHIVLWERHNGQPGFTVLPITAISASSPESGLKFGEPWLHTFSLAAGVASVRFGANADFDSTRLLIHASSPCTQEFAAEIDMDNKEVKRSHQEWQATLPQSTECWREVAISADGEPVPITIAARPRSDRVGRCVLRLYGAYGVPLEPEFDAAAAVLLEKGWTVVYAHVRGGGEFGRRWHHGGRQEGKLSALQDAQACLDYLLACGLAEEGGIALQASSAGGVVAGNLLLKRPGCFCGATLRMPFLDLFTAMMDAAAMLTQHEWDEWGDPQSPGGIELLRRLCPYQGVKELPDEAAVSWPPVLVTVGRQDERVPPWGPAKWVAAVRQKLGFSARLYLNAVEGGHFLPPDEELEVSALEAAFLLHSCERGS